MTAARADEPTARETASAPAPGEESGRIDDVYDRPASTGRVIARGVLFVPRLLVAAVTAPVRGTLYLYDRYQIGDWYWRTFWNDSRTIGVVPTARLDSGWGFNVGGKFVVKDVLGQGEQFYALASTGGRFSQRYQVRGQWAGPFDALARPRYAAELVGDWEDRTREPFFGIGNSDPMIETRYSQDIRRAGAGVGYRLVGDLYARAYGKIASIDYGHSSTDISIEEVYDTAAIPGFMDGLTDYYGELELRYDSRRSVGPWEGTAMPSTGWYATIYGGYDHQSGQGLGNYFRYGADLQRFFRLGMGPRTLVARLRGEAVSNDGVAFSELPELGGATLLRGYDPNRFRDRIAAVGTLEYQWDLSRQLTANIFTDAGRVYPSFDDLTFDNMRVGFGVGLTLHSAHDYYMRAHIASSIDGSVFVHFAFDPVFNTRPREMRH